MDGAVKRLEREHNERAWQAWHTAVIARSSKPPRLTELFVNKPVVRQSWQQQQAVAKAICAAYDGTFN